MKKPAFPSDQQDKFMLRLPDGMRDRIKAAADANNRSMNAEIVATLVEKYPAIGGADLPETARAFLADLSGMPAGQKHDLLTRFFLAAAETGRESDLQAANEWWNSYAADQTQNEWWADLSSDDRLYVYGMHSDIVAAKDADDMRQRLKAANLLAPGGLGLCTFDVVFDTDGSPRVQISPAAAPGVVASKAQKRA